MKLLVDIARDPEAEQKLKVAETKFRFSVHKRTMEQAISENGIAKKTGPGVLFRQVVVTKTAEDQMKKANEEKRMSHLETVEEETSMKQEELRRKRLEDDCMDDKTINTAVIPKRNDVNAGNETAEGKVKENADEKSLVSMVVAKPKSDKEDVNDYYDDVANVYSMDQSKAEIIPAGPEEDLYSTVNNCTETRF